MRKGKLTWGPSDDNVVWAPFLVRFMSFASVGSSLEPKKTVS
jgi:hypothetical protein